MRPVLELAYTRLVPRDQAPSDEEYEAASLVAPRTRRGGIAPLGESVLQPGRAPDMSPSVDASFWLDRLAEYQRRKVEARQTRAVASGNAIIAMPALPGVTNWVPLGPSVVARGQALTRPAIGGRVVGLAISPGSARMYAATANGGVWRSDDGGGIWYSLMDGFDMDPTNFAATSLACGAIAIDLADPERVYVGTGEGDTDAIFALRLTNALPAYRGIGPIRSDDGGGTWHLEGVASASPPLAGAAFYALAVDPGDRENVVAATTQGLYQRVPSGAGFEWQQRRTGAHSTVVVTRVGGTTRFFAAPWGGPVVTSTNGSIWTTVGTGFPSSIGRVALAAQPDNPNVLYALVAATGGALSGLWRLDGAGGSWRTATGLPAALLSGGQGAYDLCVTVDPTNANRIYVGGDGQVSGGQWVSSIYRGVVTASGANYVVAATHLGARAHADVHIVTMPPGDATRLWAGTDGGLFLNQSPSGAGQFESRNVGLSALCTNYFSQNPTEPAVIFCGLQDNGTARYVGEEVWRHVQAGDGGYCVLNWATPTQVLVYANGTVYRSTDGGQDYSSWTAVQAPPWAIMAEPLVGAPYNPGTLADANRVAFGAGSTIYFSNNFGSTWPTTVALPSGSAGIYSMVFASAARLFVGTTNGRVFRLDLSGSSWTTTRIDNVAGGPLGVVGLVADIAIDWADGARNSVYVAMGGAGDRRHVWRFNGTLWQDRSGPLGTGLIDVEHSSIIVDPDSTTDVYVGADVGVWHSPNSGTTWSPLENGLPDAPVFDLQIHRQARLLRASLHGRGLYEYKLDLPASPDVELYIRDTQCDTGHGVTTDGNNDPSTFPSVPVWHWASPNIKVDVPTPAGYQTPTTSMDFFTFNEVLVDGSGGVGTIGPPQIVHNRVYVEVHNRGPFAAGNVQVTAAITNASTVLNPLPSGYETGVQAGTGIPGPSWTTLGVTTLTDLRPGLPQIAYFDLPSNLLPLPASLPGQSHFCLLAFAHSSQDAYAATQTNVDALTVAERKVGQRNLHIVEFLGTPPPGGITTGSWAILELGVPEKSGKKLELLIDASRYPGRVHMVVPPQLLGEVGAGKDFSVGPKQPVKEWGTKHLEVAERLYWEGKYSEANYQSLVRAIKVVLDQPLLSVKSLRRPAVLPFSLKSGSRASVFFRIDPPKDAKAGVTFSFSVVQRDAEKGTVHGGSTYLVAINRPVKEPKK